jgi:hypothetical protein
MKPRYYGRSENLQIIVIMNFRTLQIIVAACLQTIVLECLEQRRAGFMAEQWNGHASAACASSHARSLPRSESLPRGGAKIERDLEAAKAVPAAAGKF